MPDSENHSADSQQQVMDYPHQLDEVVTAGDLAAHFEAHPDAYHPGLHEPITRVLGGHATVSAAQEQAAPYGLLPSGAPRTRPPLTESQMRELVDYHSYVFGPADDALYEEDQRVPLPPVPLDVELFFDLYTLDRDGCKLD